MDIAPTVLELATTGSEFRHGGDGDNELLGISMTDLWEEKEDNGYPKVKDG